MRGPRFETRLKPRRLLELALLKMGFDPPSIAAMPEGVAMAYLAAHGEMINPPKQKKYKVLRNKGNG